MMFTRALKCLGLASLLATPAVAQFGIKKDKATSFEELNEMAKNQLGGMGMPDLANMDMDELQKMIEEAMNDPSMMEAMNGLNQGVGAAMEQLASMDADTLKKQMQEGLAMLTTPEMIETVLGQKEEVLASLKAQGLVDDETLAKYENDPDFFETEMARAFEQMKEIFNNPEAVEAATQMLKGFSDVMANPQKAMKEIASMFAGDLSDDDKIEEARLQLLTNPSKAGHPALAQMFQNEEMQAILKDPVKWRNQVKMGQSMLLGEESDSGFGMGEL
jgi:hypothetical protein